MSDEYKDRYIIIALLKTPPRYYRQCKKHHSGSQRTELEGNLIRQNKGSPKYDSRSTAEITMNPIGQNIPVIYLHLEGTSKHTPSGQSRVFLVTQLRTDGVHCRESAGTGLVNLKVEHTHY